jgi:hypothetical protein
MNKGDLLLKFEKLLLISHTVISRPKIFSQSGTSNLCFKNIKEVTGITVFNDEHNLIVITNMLF